MRVSTSLPSNRNSLNAFVPTGNFQASRSVVSIVDPGGSARWRCFSAPSLQSVAPRVDVDRDIAQIVVGHAAKALRSSWVRAAQSCPRRLVLVRLHRGDEVVDAPAAETRRVGRQVGRGVGRGAADERVGLAAATQVLDERVDILLGEERILGERQDRIDGDTLVINAMREGAPDLLVAPLVQAFRVVRRQVPRSHCGPP